MDALKNLAKESKDQMQSQFGDVYEKIEELSGQIILKESGSTKRSAQEFSRKFLNQRKCYFYPNCKLHSDGINTDPLDIGEPRVVLLQVQHCIEIA